MKRTWIQTNAGLVEVTKGPSSSAHYVIPDIEPFQSPGGAEIMGRAQWREHLKATDTVEMGHSDVRAMNEAWDKKRSAHAALVARAGSKVKQMDAPVRMDKPAAPTALSVELANRLHGRPQPGRKEMIQLSLQTAREMNRRG